MNTAGGGWLAFYQHTVKDVLQDTYPRTTYDQTFPTAGIPVSVEQRTVTGDKLIRSVSSTLAMPAEMELAGTTPPRPFPRVEESTTGREGGLRPERWQYAAHGR